MAVELRCPDCRAKLTLKKAPVPGSEVECPECYAIFDAPDDAGAEAGDDAPPRKRPRDDDDDRPARKPKKEKKSKPAAAGKDPNAPRKRKAKKKETNKVLLAGLIAGGVGFLVVVGGMLSWYFLRKPASYELMNYLPADCISVQGANVRHVRLYTEFYKKFESIVNETGFKKAGDAVAKAVGADSEKFIDYMVTGVNGKDEGGIVLKASAAFDGDALSKMPGARKGTADGRTYYTVDPIPGVFKGGRLRVFAPTAKLVVVCPESVPMGTFNRMIAGTPGDDALPAKLGPVGARASKGTAWSVIILDSKNKPKKPEGDGADEWEAQAATAAAPSNAFGFKATVGSRTVRFEAMLQFGEVDGADGLLQRFRDSPLKDRDDVEPPRYWKAAMRKWVANRKVENDLLSSVSATRSGTVFIIWAESDTNNVMDAASGIVSKMTGTEAGSAPALMPGAGPPGAGPPGGRGGAPPAGGGGGAGPTAVPGAGAAAGVVIP